MLIAVEQDIALQLNNDKERIIIKFAQTSKETLLFTFTVDH